MKAQLWRPSLRTFFTVAVIAVSGVWHASAFASQLHLTWADTSSNEDGFKVERKIGTTGAFSQIASVAANSSSYIDANVTDGTTYCYRTSAFNTSGTSAPSNEACGTLTARFILTVSKNGTGSGTINSIGINCGTDCSEAYLSGTTVTLTPSPAANSTFAGWSGNADCADGSVAITAATTCTATFTGSLKVQIGVFRPSTVTWLLDLNSNGTFDNCTIDSCPASFGISSDRPLVGDWTGTGTMQLGTFDPSTRVWELDRNANDKWEDCTIDLCKGPFGRTGDLPLSGYWKAGTASTQIGVFRPANALWYLDLNGNGRFDKGSTDAKLGPFGASTSLPVVGDWTGSGTTKIGTFDPATGMWQLDRNSNGIFDGCAVDGCVGPFGKAGNLPVVADWNGTGIAKIGTFDSATGMWQLDMNGNGIFDGCASDACVGPFGQQGDRPVVGKW
jgi:hypothetical protein